MDAEAKQYFIRRKARENGSDAEGAGILWSRHGVAELANEGWSRKAVESGLEGAGIIEDYATVHRPLPDCLVLGRLKPGIPFHAVVAIDSERDRVLIVTVYRPSAEEWENDWKTRRG